MPTAIVLTTICYSFAAYVSIKHFGLSVSELVHQFIAANVASFIGLLLTQNLGRNANFKAIVIPSVLRTWIFFVAVFYCCMWVMVPFLRIENRLFVLLAPLFFSNVFGVWAFGPVQDWIVRRQKNGE
ncbi:MAG: hypothetical protein AB7F43_00380 [Bacteriovoracia bacterium]